MNRKIAIFFGMMAILLGSVLSSCGDDKDSLSGYYACEEEEGYGMVYEFINDSNVIFYPNAHKGRYTSPYGVSFNQQIGKSNWYMSDLSESRSYTYVLEEGTLVIPMQGKVFQVSGNSIREDGTSRVYTKQ